MPALLHSVGAGICMHLQTVILIVYIYSTASSEKGQQTHPISPDYMIKYQAPNWCRTDIELVNTRVILCPSLSPFVMPPPVACNIFQGNWAKQTKETFMGGLGSYLLVCVVLSFLQLHPSAEIARAHSVSTLGKLLLDFFRYYGQDSQNIYVIRFDFRILGHGHSSFMINVCIYTFWTFQGSKWLPECISLAPNPCNGREPCRSSAMAAWASLSWQVDASLTARNGASPLEPDQGKRRYAWNRQQIPVPWR